MMMAATVSYTHLDVYKRQARKTNGEVLSTTVFYSILQLMEKFAQMNGLPACLLYTSRTRQNLPVNRCASSLHCRIHGKRWITE